MSSRIRAWLFPLTLAIAAVGGVSASQEQLLAEPAKFDNAYRDGDYGRVRDADAGVTMLRAEWDHERDQSDSAGLNSPVFPGDAILTDGEQRVEVQLAGGSLVWIDRQSELKFLALPDPYSEFPDNAVLQLVTGRMGLATSLMDDEEFRIDTPGASIYPLGDADVRIQVDEQGTRVDSRSGVVEVVSQGGSVLLRAGMRTHVRPGTIPDEPQPFNTFAADGFERWVERRGEAYGYGEPLAEEPDAYRELPEEVRPYYRELSASGEWLYLDDYGYVWQPSDVAADWRPYHDGYWGYGPQGYFWISSEPWGWAPYHYGRWSWVSGFGWCWSAGSVFGGAWVSWSWGSAYVGWGPLNYWNYPAYRAFPYYGYYDPYCWTFVSYTYFGHRNYSHYSVGWQHVRHDIHRSAAVTRPPRVSPGRLARSADARQRALRDVRGDRRFHIPRDERGAGGARDDRGFRVTEDRGPTRSGRDSGKGRDLDPPGQRNRTLTLHARTRGDGGGRTPAAGRDGRAATPENRGRIPVVDTPRYLSGRGGTAFSRRSVSPQGSGRTNERVRDLYRKMAQPRKTASSPKTNSSSRRQTRSAPKSTLSSSGGKRGKSSHASGKPQRSGKRTGAKSSSRPSKPRSVRASPKGLSKGGARSSPARRGGGSRRSGGGKPRR